MILIFLLLLLFTVDAFEESELVDENAESAFINDNQTGTFSPNRTDVININYRK